MIAKQINLINDLESSNGYEIPDEQDAHFWIIQLETGKVTGPMDYSALTKKIEELQIAKDIVLKKVEDLNKNYTY